VFGSYHPITPGEPPAPCAGKAHGLRVITFQAEGEIAAICSAIGASYGGDLGVTSSSEAGSDVAIPPR
jgi:2-oxoglutarate ferredoxin oxidoreductase subunit alpha